MLGEERSGSGRRHAKVLRQVCLERLGAAWSTISG